MMKQLWKDETGFIVSAELVLVATLLVIGLVVGLAEVQSAVVQELNDVGEAVGRLNQSYFYSGFAGFKNFGGGFGGGWGFGGGFKAYTPGSVFFDGADSCDYNECALACAGVSAEYGKGGNWGGGALGGGTRGGGVRGSNSCAASCAIGR